MATITDVTRRQIIDILTVGGIHWAGRLSEDDFLMRLYDLEALPSNDYRFPDASGDIWMHRVNNHDWDADWVFYDSRFDLIHSPDEVFLRFLAETIHPVARPDVDESSRIAELYNTELHRDGWELAPRGEISGRPVYGWRQVGTTVELFVEPTGWPLVDRQAGEIRARLREASTEEQFQAVGLLCREALISVAQATYDAARHPTEDGVTPSKTDAKRMLTAVITVELAGEGNKPARQHAKAAFDLANGVQHDRAATFRDMALCAEAALSVVRIMAVLSGRRDGWAA